jgi:hypothetical protein
MLKKQLGNEGEVVVYRIMEFSSYKSMFKLIFHYIIGKNWTLFTFHLHIAFDSARNYLEFASMRIFCSRRAHSHIKGQKYQLLIEGGTMNTKNVF